MNKIKIIRIFALLIGFIIFAGLFPASAADKGVIDRFNYQGSEIEGRIIGPGLPPPNWNPQATLARVTTMAGETNTITDVPALIWSYGCSATSAGMYFGYYDRHSYPNMYTGPTNNGVFPLDNSVWGPSAIEPGEGENPLSATHQGIDGRVTKGHVDDYYFGYLSNVDPYSGYWTQHSPKDSVGDFMGTNQFKNWRNFDGSTTFFFNTKGKPLSDYTGSEFLRLRDGAHGMKLFAESRGYAVTANYNQYISGFQGNTAGFTYDQYKSEIDVGYPVLIQLSGHTILGIGYSGTNQVIVHDTWDYSDHTMTWGGTYGGMVHQGVTVFHLAPVTQTGSISITSTPPGANVILDGVNQQVKTPTTLAQITPGAHTVKLTKLGYKAYTTQVTVLAGQTTSINANLVRILA